MKDLTQKQLDTLIYIQDYTLAVGRAPQLKAIAHHFRITSGAVRGRIRQLSSAGYVFYKPHFPVRVLRMPTSQVKDKAA